MSVLGENRAFILKIVADVSEAQKGMQQLETDTKSMRDRMVGVGKSVVTGLAIGAVVQFGRDAVGAAMAADDAMDGVTAVFGEASAKVAEYGEAASKSMGLSEAAYGTMVTKAGAMMTDVGIPMDQAAESTHVLAQRAADLAITFGTTAPEAMDAIAQAMKGSTRGLTQYGLVITSAEIEARALSKGYVDAAGDVTQAGTAIAAQELILEQSAASAGQFAANSGDLGTKQQILAADMENLKTTIGEALLPVLEKLLGAVQPIIQFMSDNAGWLMPLVGILLAIAAALKVYTIVQAIANITLMAFPVVWIIAGIIAIIAIIVLIVKHWDTIKEAVIKAYEAVKEWVTKAWDFLYEIGSKLFEILTWPYRKAIELIIGLIQSIVDFFWKLPGIIGGFLSGVWNVITWPFRTARDFIMSAFDGVMDFFYKLPGRVGGFFSGLAGIISGPFTAAFDGIKWLWNHTIGAISFTIPTWVPVVGGNSFSMPKMAEGGIVTGPMIALLGEAGREAVIPLDKFGSLGSTTYNVNVYALNANSETGRLIAEALREYERTSGRTVA